ncbi:MAG: xanthine dehydrogenase family protein subunit M [Candidatus Kapabacteria bacterium]|nr:xanthine dehydrogenase family protein subunit M [Candidatus Kapabacteria bacterium]
MYIPDFKYHSPETLEEALKVFGSNDSIAPIAGGTDLLVEIKQGVRHFENLVSLNNIPELKNISEDENYVYIGPCVTHSEIEESDIVRNNIPALAETVGFIGSHQIRNSGTIGGNVCTCASCADTAPILIAYEADVEVSSAAESKRLPIATFFLNHHQTMLSKGELLTNIIIPKPKPNTGVYFEKFGLRESASISVASVAVSIIVKDKKIIRTNIVVGACASTPKKCPSAMKVLVNADPRELVKGSKTLSDIANAALKDIFPIDDIRGSAQYRLDIVKTLIIKAVLNAFERSFSLNIVN